jgi:prepilin-type N-terminal cleavage/methylation domain-containing protein
MRRRQKGFSLIELLIVVAIILIIVAMAVPNLLRSRISANEASAVSSLRTLNAALVLYNSTYGAYPAQLSYLQPPASGNPTSAAADLIDQVLASGTKSGYTFTYTQGPSGASYTIVAHPLVSNQTGLRYFYSDQSGVTRFNVGADANISSSPLN